MKVAIIGGGIAGLSAAYDLQKAGIFEVTLFEQSSSVGGKIQTAQEGEFLIEQGPDSIFSAKPWAVQLMCELGMESELMEPLESEFSIQTKGKLHSVPRPLASLIPSANGALEKAGFLTAAAKRRALKEAEVGRGDGGDESIASFFRRRFGRTFSELVAEPLLAGTHAGDPEKLSMAALYPSYLGMEKEHGSVSEAAAKRTSAGTGHKVGFLTLSQGMGVFPQKLAEALTTVKLLLSTRVKSLRAASEGVEVETEAGLQLFDHVILATPAYITAKIIRDLAPAAAAHLSQIRFVSTAIVSLAYPRNAFAKPLTGNGFLVPTSEPSPITGCTWSSNKWAGRAPSDTLLVRAFMGRDGGLNIDEKTDAELIGLATETLSGLLNPKQSPLLTRLDRWSKGMAQYELGHLGRIAAIESDIANLPISLVGASYKGNSIPDCIRQGREAARALIESHAK